MGPCKFCTAGSTSALEYAAAALERLGWVRDNHAKLLLLPVPSFEPDGTLKGGGAVEDVLKSDTVVFGGNLKHPQFAGHRCVDLLQDARYLAENAAITAHCALKIAMGALPVTLQNCPVLVVGWGRIGKCLADLLKRLGAAATVYARKEADRAMLAALGYGTKRSLSPADDLGRYRVVFNTAPTMLLPEGLLQPEQLKIDLASAPGIEGADVICARGLPNKDAPESSGELIARTVNRLGKEFLL